MTDIVTPNPGSDEAVKQGCLCPVIDNGRGKGAGVRNDDGTPIFWISSECPIHGIHGHIDARPA